MKLAIELRLLALRIQHAALSNVIEHRIARHMPSLFVQRKRELVLAKIIQEEMKVEKRAIKRAA